MIVATAGHIDHGKTSLVKALTGVDTDRLPEEKRRGLSIDIGFAYPKDKSSALGFVDVPGHERFVRNMIAGVTAIDCALLTIAADDGPMPQTAEHLAILTMLGVSLGAVALTKIDRISPERILEARAEIADLLKGTRLAYAPLFPVSALTGEGVDVLRQWLEEQAATHRARRGGGYFRIAVDRAFLIEGAGVVATGAVSSGEAKIDDRLILAPAGIEVRLRGVHAQNRKAAQARAGERCALNIAAPRLSLDQVHRGAWFVAPEIHRSVTRLDARISLLESEAKSLRHWSPVHLHIGAADVLARVALLEGALAPGETALAQLVLQRPIIASFGDRFVLRDQSAQRTLGGGAVIDIFAPTRGRARPERLAQVRALESADPKTAARQLLALSPTGLRLGDFICGRNLGADAARALRSALTDTRFCGEGSDELAFASASWNALRENLATLIREAKADGLTRATMASRLRPRVAASALDGLLADLIAKGEIVHAGGLYRGQGVALEFDKNDAALWLRVERLLDDLRPPSLAEIADELKCDPRALARMLRRAARMGLAVQIAQNRYYLPPRLRELAAFAQDVARETPLGLVSIRAFRDKSGVGRNLSVDALEFFDRLGFTARAGEHRRVMKTVDQVRWARGGGG